MKQTSIKIINDAVNAANKLQRQFTMTPEQYKECTGESPRDSPYLPDMNKIAYWTIQMDHLRPCPKETRDMGRMGLKVWQQEEEGFLLDMQQEAKDSQQNAKDSRMRDLHILEWGKAEISRSSIVRSFLEFHALLETKTNSARVFMETSPLLQKYFRRMYVHNIAWVHAFSWIFPKIDPSKSEAYREAGKMMIASSYVELVYKERCDFPQDLTTLHPFNNIEHEYLYAFPAHRYTHLPPAPQPTATATSTVERKNRMSNRTEKETKRRK